MAKLCHSGKPISSFSLGFVNFPAGRFLTSLTESMKQYEGIIAEVKEQDAVAAWTKFPDPIFQMFGDLLPEAGSILTKKLNVTSDLLMLNPGVTVGGRLRFKA